MSGSFTSLPNNSNFSFYDKYRKDDELFGQQIFNKAAFSIWSKLGESVLNKQRVILSSSHEGKIFYAIFSMSTTIGKPTHKYSLSDYAEFNDVEQLKVHIASNKITNLCCCYSEKMPDNLDGIDVKHYIKIANAYNTKLSAVRPKLSLILGEGQHLQAKSAITVIVGSDQFDKPIFKELTTTWKELLGNAINGVDGVVVTLNVLFDGFGNILLQAKTSGNPKKILLSIPAETANIKTVSVAKPAAKNKKGKVQKPGATLASALDKDNRGKMPTYNNISQANEDNKSVIDILRDDLHCEERLKTLKIETPEDINKLKKEELKQLLDIINWAIRANVFYFDTCVWLEKKWHDLIKHVIKYCEANNCEKNQCWHIVQSSVFNELDHIKNNPQKTEEVRDAARKALIIIGKTSKKPIGSYSFIDGEEHLELHPNENGYGDRAIAAETVSYYIIGQKVLIISNDVAFPGGIWDNVNNGITGHARKNWPKVINRNEDKFPCIVTAWELQQVLTLKDKLSKLVKEQT